MLELKKDHHTHFKTFGFVVLRQVLDPVRLVALIKEADRAARDAAGRRFRQRNHLGGIEGHHIPATCEHTPASLDLAMKLAPLGEELLDMQLLLSVAQHILFFDIAAWHSDTGFYDVQGLRIVAYLDPLNADNGALRVLPGSHALPEEHFDEIWPGNVDDDDAWQEANRAVPCHVIDSRPGDLIIFDERLWHASVGGRDRRQRSATFVGDPKTSDDETLVRERLASEFVLDLELDYDASRFPYYGTYFRETAPSRWVQRLERLGAFDAAGAEEGHVGADGASSQP